MKLDRAALSQILFNLCEWLAEDLARKGYLAQCVGIKIRFEDFTTITRDQTLTWPIADTASLREAVRTCLKRVTLDRRLRLMGIRAGGLVKEGAHLLQASEPAAVAEYGLFNPPCQNPLEDQFSSCRSSAGSGTRIHDGI